MLPLWHNCCRQDLGWMAHAGVPTATHTWLDAVPLSHRHHTTLRIYKGIITKISLEFMYVEGHLGSLGGPEVGNTRWGIFVLWEQHCHMPGHSVTAGCRAAPHPMAQVAQVPLQGPPYPNQLHLLLTSSRLWSTHINTPLTIFQPRSLLEETPTLTKSPRGDRLAPEPVLPAAEPVLPAPGLEGGTAQALNSVWGDDRGSLGGTETEHHVSATLL